MNKLSEVQAGDCVGRFDRNSDTCTKCELRRDQHRDYNETEHSPSVPDVDRCVGECGHTLLPDAPLDELGRCTVGIVSPGGDINDCGCTCVFSSIENLGEAEN